MPSRVSPTLRGGCKHRGRKDGDIAHECPAMSLVRKLWEGEGTWHSAGENSAMLLEDKQVLQLWTSTTRAVAGHYELPTPFRDEEPDLPNNNNEMAQKRRNT